MHALPPHTLTRVHAPHSHPRLALKITRAVALVRRLGTTVRFSGVSIALTMFIM